jgi:hypothetical protein
LSNRFRRSGYRGSMLGILSLSRNSTGDREMLEWTGAARG